MKRRRARRVAGEGTAWLPADGSPAGHLCYWYAGPQGDHLVERGRATSATRAVAWGRARTPMVRIRTAGATTQWAGSGPAPDGFAGLWSEDRPGG